MTLKNIFIYMQITFICGRLIFCAQQPETSKSYDELRKSGKLLTMSNLSTGAARDLTLEYIKESVKILKDTAPQNTSFDLLDGKIKQFEENMKQLEKFKKDYSKLLDYWVRINALTYEVKTSLESIFYAEIKNNPGEIIAEEPSETVGKSLKKSLEGANQPNNNISSNLESLKNEPSNFKAYAVLKDLFDENKQNKDFLINTYKILTKAEHVVLEELQTQTQEIIKQSGKEAFPQNLLVFIDSVKTAIFRIIILNTKSDWDYEKGLITIYSGHKNNFLVEHAYEINLTELIGKIWINLSNKYLGEKAEIDGKYSEKIIAGAVLKELPAVFKQVGSMGIMSYLMSHGSHEAHDRYWWLKIGLSDCSFSKIFIHNFLKFKYGSDQKNEYAKIWLLNYSDVTAKFVDREETRCLAKLLKKNIES